MLRDIICWIIRRFRGGRGSLSLAGLTLAILAGMIVAEALVALMSVTIRAFAFMAISSVEGWAKRDVLCGVSIETILASLRFLTFADFGFVR